MRPEPIPLRPDRDAWRQARLRTLVRAATATARSALSGPRGVDPIGAAKELWPDDYREVALLLRSPTAPMKIADADALAQILTAFLSSLVPVSAAADLFNRALRVSFDGVASISVPAIAPPAAAFVGEGQPVPVRLALTSAKTLEPYKLATLTGLTGEMIRHSNVEALVRQALVESVGPALDAALFSTAAGVAELNPPGILNGIAPLTATAGGGATAMMSDLRQLVNAVAATAGNGGIVFVMAAAQDVALSTLPTFRYPRLISGALPSGTVIAISVNGLVSASGEVPRIDASIYGTAHEETDPLPIVDGTPASPVRSYFQTDSLALRLRVPVSWALRSPNALAWVQAVTW